VLDAFGALLPRGEYLPLLLDLSPRLLNPGDDAAKTLVTLGLTYDEAKRKLTEAFEKHRAA
jgi:hypothetical protein